MKDLLCIGMALVDKIYKGDEINYYPGGEAVNESVAARKLEMDTAAVCGLPTDEMGLLVRKTLEEGTVDLSYAVTDDTAHTPVTEIFLDENGQRTSKISEDHKLLYFYPENILDTLPQAKYVSVCSLFRAPFVRPEGIYKVCKWAKDTGAILLADTKIPKYDDIGIRDIADALELIDYIFPNDQEAKYLTGKDDPEEAANIFLGYGVKNVIIKMGAQGCFFKNPYEKYRVPALPVKAIDATGAGDNFIVGFACALNDGMSHRDALSFATGCAALNCIRHGGIAGPSCKAEVYNIL